MANLSRRLFLRNSAVGALASTVAVPAIAQVTERYTALARARHHYDQFAAAMDELTTGYPGWIIRGGGHVREFSAPGCRTINEYAWLAPQLVQYETGTEPRCPSLVVERHHEIIGIQRQREGWLDEPLRRDDKGVRL